MKDTDTITAISTPIGKSGIGIVRLSGPNAIEITSKIFQSPSDVDLSAADSHTLHYGHIYEGENKIDEVLVSVMHSPNTYTREDVAEINCHGGVVPLRETLELTLDHGARPAEPGEFTKRAFLNGRLSLDQAQSVDDIIQSKTRFSLDLAMERLEGKFSSLIKSLKEDLTDILAEIGVALDFPDYEESILDSKELHSSLTDISEQIETTLSRSRDGKILREGFKVAILGKPNVGKSTLLNQLLKEERAIVTPVPGTTRDTIEEELEIEGIPFKIIDTAGIREPENEIEQKGISKAQSQGQRADLVLVIVDADDGIQNEDQAIGEEIPRSNSILLLNKIDLEPSLSQQSVLSQLGPGWADVMEISAKKGWGVEELGEKMTELVWGGKVGRSEEIFLLNVREKKLLKEARGHLEEAAEALTMDRPIDLVELDIRQARESLGELLGEDVSEEVIDRMFSNFCVGK